MCVHSLLGRSHTCSVQQYTSKNKKSQEGKITRGPVRLFLFFLFVFGLFFFLCEYEQLLASQCSVEGMRARWERGGGLGGQNVQDESWSWRPSQRFSRALVVKVGLFDAPAEGQQVAVALDPLGQLGARQPGGEDSEEVAEHQRVQLRRPAEQKPFLITAWRHPDAGVASCSTRRLMATRCPRMHLINFGIYPLVGRRGH